MIAKFFGFLRSCVQFIKIILMFITIMLMLYWVADLKSVTWDWMNFIKPVVEFLLNIGASIYDESFDCGFLIFKFKFPITIILVMLLTFIPDFINENILEKLEDKYNDTNRTLKRINENAYNNGLNRQQTIQQKRINKYEIFVTTKLKDKFSHAELGYNLDEQNKIMNKFLMEKTGIVPQKLDDGYLYTFNYFEKIDSVLEIFFKLIKSNSAMDYVICVQITGDDSAHAQEQLKYLASLKFENKISMLSDTAYRYKFNQSHRYGTSQLGLFQKDDSTVEVHEFIEII